MRNWCNRKYDWNVRDSAFRIR